MTESKKVSESAKQNIIESFEEQREVYSKIVNKKPLEAEDDDYRKIAFISNRLEASRAMTKSIIAGEDLSTLNLNAFQQFRSESLQGDSIDFMGVNFLDLASAASNSIARITDLNGTALGTGFMISPNLFITNNHVISTQAEAERILLEFDYQVDYLQKPLTSTRFRLSPNSFFLTNAENDLDFTIVAVGGKHDGSLELSHYGFLPLIESPDKHIKGMYVNCIQHPSGMHKQLVVRENRLLYRAENTLIYASDTLPGSSGSPIFNDTWEVIALHHWGEPYRDLIQNVSADFPKFGNEGIRISVICSFLRTVKFNEPAKNAMLQQALSPVSRYPSCIMIKEKGNDLINYNFNNEPMKRENLQTSFEGVVNNAMSFTVPLTISVQIGQQQLNPVEKAVENTSIANIEHSATSSEGLKPDSDYASRKGYDKGFLGIPVEMPALSAIQKEEAARNRWTNSQENPFELKYQHFSVVMNGRRRLPFFTAVNIDGASVVKIDRKTGVVTRGPESAEGREKWYDDDRVGDDQICEDTLYTSAPMSMFQRGHLVKRTDPSWASNEKALRGQADTFHFTNCAPQHFRFNPVKSRWAGIEDWITNTSDDDNIRVSVFSGPVFNDTDRLIGYLKIPQAFWKVVVWVKNGRLKATAVFADQSDLLESIGSESTGDLGQLPEHLPDEYHCSISYIEQITSLKFNLTAESDTYISTHEGAGPEGNQTKRKITEFNSLLLGEVL